MIFNKILILFTISLNLFAQDFNLYLDADMTVNKAAGVAIKNGITAGIKFYKKENPKSKIKLNLIELDHRGNTRRSLANFKKVLKDPNAIAVFGGLHSPPLITNNKFINENKVLTLVSWAAGGPITRSKLKENWIYRLSIDDSQAGSYIATQAIKHGKCKRPYLLLENTPWGKSNKKNMTIGLNKEKVKVNGTSLFDWGVSNSSSSQLTDKIITSNSDCIFFVGNSKDAERIFNAFGKKKIRIPIYSHWGITGTDGKKMSSIITKNNLNVKILQTNFTFIDNKISKFQRKVKKFILDELDYKNVGDLKPMSGWVHSFDLSLIFLNALEKSLKIEKGNLKDNLKKEIENPNLIVRGLIKKYSHPFKKYSITNKNAHEALTKNDYILRKFIGNGSLK